MASCSSGLNGSPCGSISVDPRLLEGLAQQLQRGLLALDAALAHPPCAALSMAELEAVLHARAGRWRSFSTANWRALLEILAPRACARCPARPARAGTAPSDSSRAPRPRPAPAAGAPARRAARPSPAAPRWRSAWPPVASCSFGTVIINTSSNNNFAATRLQAAGSGPTPIKRRGMAAQRREFKAAPRSLAVMSTIGITRS